MWEQVCKFSVSEHIVTLPCLLLYRYNSLYLSWLYVVLITVLWDDSPCMAVIFKLLQFFASICAGFLVLSLLLDLIKVGGKRSWGCVFSSALHLYYFLNLKFQNVTKYSLLIINYGIGAINCIETSLKYFPENK